MIEEKIWKKYIRCVKWRLNLPKEVKARVMSDFESSIRARIESGMTPEQIKAELGSPKKAAADLNEQMKEFAYRKSPWRYVFAGVAAYGGAEFLGKLWSAAEQLILRFYLGKTLELNDASIGIIGGADGPTAIFVSGPVGSILDYILPVIVLIIGIWGFLRLCRCKQK